MKDVNNPYEMTMDIWFKDGGSVKNVDVPSEFIDPSGNFLSYWENVTDLKCVNTDTVDRFVLKNAYTAE